MNSLTNKTPFLFRNKKPTLKTHNKTHDVSSPVLDGIAIINVEPNNHYKLISANDIFINYINGNDDNSLGANLLDIFWGENIEDNQIYPQIQKAHSHGQARAFIWNLLINGKDHSILCKIIPLQNKLGLVHQITIMTSEFEDNNGLEIELESYNYFDALTGLPNRFKLLDILNEKYSNSSNIEAAVLFINIKKLQRINESYGYDYGDQAIRSVAEQLQSLTDQNALIARFTDDNFVIILTAEATRNVKHDAQNLAKSIHHNIKLSSDSSIRLSFSIGIATGEISAYKIEQIMQNAHLAMKRNNDHNTTQTIVFNPELKTQASSKLLLETELRDAITNNSLELHYQPLINLQNGLISGFEALARWNSSKRGNVSPLEFISLAEEVGLIIPLGEWALNKACNQLKSWIDNDPLAANLFMAINISSSHILTGDITSLTRDALAKSGLKGNNLKLELTESTIMENSDIAQNILLDLKTLGISLAVDDFGTGYSSLSYLSHIPADTIKIDRSFVKKINSHSEGLNIIRVIINLANSLGMTVIAEGIETEEQLIILKKLGCHYGQGYFFSKALTADKVPEYIQKQVIK